MKEKNLIKQYMENDELNIEKIMENYTPYLYTILKNKKPNIEDEDIEEIISDVFLVVWKNRKKLELEKDMSSYLVGVLKNLYYPFNFCSLYMTRGLIAKIATDLNSFPI